MHIDQYNPGDFYDELFLAEGAPRPDAVPLIERIRSLSMPELQQRQQAAQAALFQLGVTFNVYGDNQGTERIFPFDIIPRIVSLSEWDWLDRGLKQRIHALNLFLDDIYGEQKILKDKVIPEELIYSATGFLKPCIGLKPPQGIWCHITGTDLVRDRDGQWYVLEDNLRCPSGVSYVLENRRVMKTVFPLVFNKMAIKPVEDYASYLLET
ncbi:MAG: circularly permuted type 2 ATP-grasp protein, partial [Oculatellaceae cyanobacterium Prado106]|nr:circularly permuted type 2 ATP-grasp protein [Oculatellaceae cyanobacterium Prado106]